MEQNKVITIANLLIFQALSLIDKGYILDIDEMTTQVSLIGLEKYLTTALNTRLTVERNDNLELLSKNLINFWNVTDNEKHGIKNNGLIYLVFSLLHLNESGYREDLYR